MAKESNENNFSNVYMLWSSTELYTTHTSPEIFKDEYSCMMAGYTTAASMTQDMGREEVNKHDIYIKFECHPYKITFPKLQPGIDS